jgi:hypothetical protein
MPPFAGAALIAALHCEVPAEHSVVEATNSG